MNLESLIQIPIVALIVIVTVSILASLLVYLPLRDSAVGDFNLFGFKLKLAGPSAVFFALLIVLCFQYIQFLKIVKSKTYTIKIYGQFLPKGHNLIPGDNTMTIVELPKAAVQEIHLPDRSKYYSGSIILSAPDTVELPNIELSHSLFEPKTFILSNYKKTVKGKVIEINDTLKIELIKRKQ